MAPLVLVIIAIAARHKLAGGEPLGPILKAAGLTFAAIVSAPLTAAVFGAACAAITGTAYPK